ncbi:MAG: immunoglobulin domain-containing protein, partial [Chitinophagaceae bacterium]|nr:immunoglobulin domain-containing protein [Chitinophagaceae bacterium]
MAALLLSTTFSIAQTNLALTATATHSGGGAGSFAANNYNDGVIAAFSGCSSSAQPWGWVSSNGSITFTWSSAVTFNKIVLYKSNRPMTSCQMQYWNGSAFVTFLSYSGSTCSQDSVTFSPVTTTILRFLSVSGSSNPNHREIQVWQTAPPPPTISGTAIYCPGETITLTASSAAPSPIFTWSGPAGFTFTGATMTLPSITPANAGTYSCVVSSGGGAASNPATRVVSINPAPASISGLVPICEGASTTLTNATAGGTWISGSANATIGSTSGVVSAISSGTALITYRLLSTGCQNTGVLSINPLPATIDGTLAVCLGNTTSLSNSDGGGTWTSSNLGVATVNSVTGSVSSVSVGLSTISYTISTGCVRTAEVSVNPLPSVTVTPSSTTLCAGENVSVTATSPDPTFSLLNQNFNSGLSGWIVSGSAAPANMWQIVNSTTAADGTPGDGTDMLQSAAQGTLTNSTITSTSFNTVGYGSATLKFDQYLLSASPDAAATIQYSTDGGGTWTTLEEQAGTIVGGPSFTPGA